MNNIFKGSVKITNKTKDKLKFVSILFNLSNGVNPAINEDKFIDEQISKLNLLKIDTDYEIKFDL
jgi:hypothetical protein